MDANKVNRWLTLGANLGVLVGIILILIELNQNAELMRAQMTQARGDNVVQTYRDLMLSDAWVEIRAKQRSANSIAEWVESLSPTEYERVWYRQLVEYHSLRTQFYQYQSGYLDPLIWESSARGQARRFMRVMPHFPITADDASEEYKDFLNAVAQDAGLPTFEFGEKASE